MTRTTDDMQPAERWRPLGEKVTPVSPPAPTAPAQQPRGEYGVVQGSDGCFRTTKIPKG